eukprot:scpid94092/ scgid10284/ PR domain zinc finger protein 5; PR domain-containing protein 5
MNTTSAVRIKMEEDDNENMEFLTTPEPKHSAGDPPYDIKFSSRSCRVDATAPHTPMALKVALTSLLGTLRDKEQAAAIAAVGYDEDKSMELAAISDVESCEEAHATPKLPSTTSNLHRADAGNRPKSGNSPNNLTLQKNRTTTRHLASIRPIHHNAFKCRTNTCTKTFQSQCALTAHVRSVHLTKSPVGKNSQPTLSSGFNCPICGKVFKSWALRAAHQAARHPKADTIACPVDDCGKVFQEIGSFYRHKRSHPELMAEAVTCSHCSKVCVSAHGLGVHTGKCHPMLER